MTEHIEQLKALVERGKKATQDTAKCCHHLQSIEHDKSCPCGYRGGIYGEPSHMICEMGSTSIKGQEGLELPRYERQIEIYNAHFIEAAFNNRPALEKLLADYERMEKMMKKALEIAYDVMENARNKDKSDICDKGLSRLNKALAEEQGE